MCNFGDVAKNQRFIEKNLNEQLLEGVCGVKKFFSENIDFKV